MHDATVDEMTARAMEMKGEGIYAFMCWEHEQVVFICSADINCLFMAISSSSWSDATREEAQPIPHLLLH